jgi:nitrogen regulatory protein PII
MAFQPQKKVEIIVPEALVETVLDIARREGAKGYTMLATHGGGGLTSHWQGDDPSHGNQSMLVLIIAQDAIARRIAETVFPVLREYGGIVYLSEAEVFRSDRF